MHTEDPGLQQNEPPLESPSDECLERYFAGRCGRTERAIVERWLESDAARSSAARALVSAMSSTVTRFDAERMLARTRQRIERAERSSKWRRTLRAEHMPRIALAAAALLVVTVGLTMYTSLAPRERATPVREVVAKPGQQTTVDLADGSRVVLAAGSRLEIPSDFNVSTRAGTRRELRLVGKAHFRVEHDERRPFIVRTATAIAEDMGTEFIMRAYPENRSTEVIVVSGAVALHRVPATADSAFRQRNTSGAADFTRPLVVLAPGDAATLDSSGTVTLAHNVNTDAQVSWMKGVLVLDGERLPDALAELSRWYDVDFTVHARGMDSLQVSGEFRNESVDVAIQRLGLMLGVRFVRDGRTVMLSSSTP